MQISRIVDVLEAFAPTCHAEAWDNVGLLWGDPTRDVKHLLLTNDCTPAVIDEADKLDSRLVVSYHPPLFKALKKLPVRHVMYRALRADIAVYSPHTAWDAAPGGTNDRLCDALELSDREPLRGANGAEPCKLVFFVPPQHVDTLVRALTAAGAGHIGNYSGCHFRVSGTGGFLPEAGSKPAIGRVGVSETVEESRVEMVLPKHAVEKCVAALRAHHPYEEPAFDVLPMAFVAPAGFGMGRVGRLPRALDWDAMVALVKKQLRLGHVMTCRPQAKQVERVAVCAGAGGEFIPEAKARGAQVLLTGEVRHHDALLAQSLGLGIVATLHSNSERLSLPFIAEHLRAQLHDVGVHVSACDADPLIIL